IYTARSERVFRRNAAVMPVYQLILLFVLFVGFVAMLQVPGLKGADTDLALLRISKATFSPVVVGVIGAAGLLTALVPGSMLLIAVSTILVQNVLRPAFPSVDNRAAAILAKAIVPVVAVVGVVLTLRPGTAVVPLLLMGYSVVTELFPVVVLALPRVPLATRTGAFAGIIVGEATVAYFSLSGITLATLFPSWPTAIPDLNVGMV